ncbi:MAG: cyclic nucleotide-binding domain-containing protein [Verrucomicrobiae bacterium]|nr:cyclic nucleotide-binding domain-containing protein [Verrucomicrobiae bacterium]MCP5524481.1 cyclic nucleotide-binding domain-containing protein [Verrucomicrobiales bacterium]
MDTLCEQATREYAAGETIIEQGTRTGSLFVLAGGRVEVVKDEIIVARCDEAGAVFGDLAALLDSPHTASVRALVPSRLHVVPEAHAFLEQHPALCLHLCGLLARRLDSVNQYLVDVKKQFTGHDHLAMVDEMLDTLMHRQPRRRVVPRASTLRDPEVLE